FQLMLNNPDNLTRINEPVITKLNFSDYNVQKDSIVLYDDENRRVSFQLIDVTLNGEYIKEASIVYLVNLDKKVSTYNLYANSESFFDDIYSEEERNKGIQQLDVKQDDGFRRLDTGYYELELCSGTADGTSYGKWGIRYFKAVEEGKNLIKDYSNAIGGFYGPFFTPNNGLINPPEHTKVTAVVEEEGPLYCRYRFEGIVPNGLDENLKEKKFSITWEFFYNTPWFRRKYNVDDFSTTVDGIPVENKITVGDEFESGEGNRAFTSFASYGGTYYREGDLYAKLLADDVYILLENLDENDYSYIKAYKEAVGKGINKVSWYCFWKIYCVEEGILDEVEIKQYVIEVITHSHQQVHGTERNDNVLFDNLVNVNNAPEQTIFPMSANKTAEINDDTGYSMVWYTSEIVARYQIVQRNDSEGANWSTNGDNELPELPTGST